MFLFTRMRPSDVQKYGRTMNRMRGLGFRVSGFKIVSRMRMGQGK